MEQQQEACASLQALCTSAALASASKQPLDDMPSHVLAQLLRECSRRLQESERRLAEQLQRYEGRPLVDPLRNVDVRVDSAMLQRVKAIRRKWCPHPGDPGQQYVNNPKHTIVYDKEDRAFKRLTIEEADADAAQGRYVDTYFRGVISSPLLLYRLLCLLPVNVLQMDRYKCVWRVALQHMASGEVLYFYDERTTCQSGLEADHPNQQYVEDGIELLNLLFDPMCPHTYDGMVAA